MCLTQDPKPDGFQQFSFKSTGNMWANEYWCLYILNKRSNIVPLNHTYIALIPKVEKPKKATYLRPISLYNVIYRIVTKIIANRLKHMLHSIILPTQSAFIPIRLIIDNVVICYECLHKIRLYEGRKNAPVALKTWY